MKTTKFRIFKVAVLAICLTLSIAPNFAKAGTASCPPPSRGGNGGGSGRTGSGGASAPVNGFTGLLALGLVSYGVYVFYGINKQNQTKLVPVKI